MFLTVASVLNPSSVKKKMSICFSLLMTPILYLEMHRNPTIFENNEKPHVLFFLCTVPIISYLIQCGVS